MRFIRYSKLVQMYVECDNFSVWSVERGKSKSALTLPFGSAVYIYFLFSLESSVRK